MLARGGAPSGQSKAMTSSTRVFLKFLGLLTCVFAVQLVAVPLWALSFNGCSKYVPPQSVRELESFLVKLWGVSFLAYLLILLLFLSDFARRPKFILHPASLTTFVLLCAWKAVSIALDIHQASRCGARDTVYDPTKLVWLSPDFAFVLGAILWGLMMISAIRALMRQENTQTAALTKL